MNKRVFLDFLILAIRFTLAYNFMSYGWSKLNGGQFGIMDQSILSTPLKEVSFLIIIFHVAFCWGGQ